jgi:drug/metabolite transporter (DMT)-like permease
MGILFFTVFYAMGYASARIGVGITGASTKMSLVIPVLYGMVVLGEELWYQHILGLVFALLAILLMSVNPGEKLPVKKLFLPLFIFIGSGLVDLSINLLRMTLDDKQLDQRISIILIFSGALSAASMILLCKYRHLFRDLRSLGYGFLLGIPNYFSIYAMIKALGSGKFRTNDFYMINNTGIVVLCFVSGLLLFGEKLTWTKGTGLILSILSVCLILSANAFF